MCTFSQTQQKKNPPFSFSNFFFLSITPLLSTRLPISSKVVVRGGRRRSNFTALGPNSTSAPATSLHDARPGPARSAQASELRRPLSRPWNVALDDNGGASEPCRQRSGKQQIALWRSVSSRIMRGYGELARYRYHSGCKNTHLLSFFNGCVQAGFTDVTLQMLGEHDKHDGDRGTTLKARSTHKTSRHD